MDEVIEQPAIMAIAEYKVTAAALAELRTRLADVAYDLSTGKGLDIAKKDRAEVRGLRLALEAKRVELKAPALERSRLIDAEAKALTVELVALEKPIDEQIKAEERRKEVERVAREQVERAAAAVVQTKIDEMRNMVVSASGLSSAEIAAMVNTLAKTEITIEQFGDRVGEAAQVKGQALKVMAGMVTIARGAESEAARLIEERAELDRQRTEQEARDKSERERIAAEQKTEADRLAAERKAFEKEQAEARAEAKKREDADRARRDEEDRKAREIRVAEDKRQADSRAEMEAAQRAMREAEEEKAAAARKIEQDKADEDAAKERKRLDDEAAARRAERERQEASIQRVRDAAPVMLEALQNLENDAGQIPDHAWVMVCAAIKLATGETN